MVEGDKGVGSGFLPGPEGPTGAALKRKQYEAEMARLDQEISDKSTSASSSAAQ